MHDILRTAVADVSNGQTDMSHKGELETLTKLSMRHKVCRSETMSYDHIRVHYNHAHVRGQK